MKKIILLTFLLFIQSSYSQFTKTLDDFDSVKVFDKLKVKLIPSSENKIIIKGIKESEIEFVNKNGELKIRMPFGKLLSGDGNIIQLYFKNLEAIQANEGSFISSDHTFKQTNININASEGAEINLDLDVEKANVRGVTGGLLYLNGKATNQTVTMGTGGLYEGKDLITSQTAVNVSAGGQAAVFATTLVDAKVTAGGSIEIYGKPKQINQKTLFGGTIRER